MDDDEPLDWAGVLEPSMMSAAVVAARHRLADAAKTGDWSGVFELLDGGGEGFGLKDRPLTPNMWRPGSSKWFTPLHQAAWHGAPTPVVQRLLERGALRSLRDAKGRTARDVAVENGARAELVALLAPPASPLDGRRIALLDQHLGEVIDARVREFRLDRGFPNGDPRRALRYPPVEVLHELPGRAVWFPIPGMYGGFLIALRQGYLESSSWCRVAGGSAQLHVITHEGAILVDEEFDL
nr:ankyrin repeat domain-containing protein [Mycolicibacterium malmesburyense]